MRIVLDAVAMRFCLIVGVLTFYTNISVSQVATEVDKNGGSNYFFTSGELAIRGYDPVAYFTGQAVKGDPAHAFLWANSRWLFKNKVNLEAFRSDPEKYAPQFGGFCAYGASENHLTPADPEAFTIVDGKLYLNYNKKVKELWLKDTVQRIKRATTYWPSLLPNK